MNLPRLFPARRQRGGILMGLFFGLVVGVLVAFVVIWYLNKTPVPFQDKTARPMTGLAPEPAASGASATPPAPLPGKPGDKPNERPRFEFYKILPGDATPTPAPAALSAKAKAPATPAPAPATTMDSWQLQMGAFQRAEEADNLKAQLALLGMETHIEITQSADKRPLYRVRSGPYASQDAANRARAQAAQNGVVASLIKQAKAN